LPNEIIAQDASDMAEPLPRENSSHADADLRTARAQRKSKPFTRWSIAAIRPWLVHNPL
jgi:hypothetical protein